MNMKKSLSINHWNTENFRERMTIKEWREILLAENDRIIVAGCCRQVVAKNIGAGVVEVSKKPLLEEGGDQ